MINIKRIGYGYACILAALLVTADCATSQQPAVRSVRSIVAERQGAAGNKMVVNEFARTRTADNRSTARLDSLADALVTVALEDSTSIGASAIAELIIATKPYKGRVYGGSAKRIHEILRGARSGPTRTTALGALAEAGPLAEAIKIWREVAIEPPTERQRQQAFALNMLCSHGGDEGREVLLELHRTQAVIATGAREALDFMVNNKFERGCW